MDSLTATVIACSMQGVLVGYALGVEPECCVRNSSMPVGGRVCLWQCSLVWVRNRGLWRLGGGQSRGLHHCPMQQKGECMRWLVCVNLCCCGRLGNRPGHTTAEQHTAWSARKRQQASASKDHGLVVARATVCFGVCGHGGAAALPRRASPLSRRSRRGCGPGA